MKARQTDTQINQWQLGGMLSPPSYRGGLRTWLRHRLQPGSGKQQDVFHVTTTPGDPMQSENWLTSSEQVSDRRTILLVDRDQAYAQAVRSAWTQLWLADTLNIAADPEEALQLLQQAEQDGDGHAVSAVVLDPEVTGEGTGGFLREMRRICGDRHGPVILWTRDGSKYQVLEGRGVDSVLHKPMVLRLIQLLDESCHLRVRQFQPYQGDMIIQ